MVTIEREYLGKLLRLQAFCVGEDWCVICSGGERPHVGAVSLSQAYCSYGGKPTADLSCVSVHGHKDTELGNLLARHIAKTTGKNAAVICGIHYDDLNHEQIGEIVALCREMCDIALKSDGCEKSPRCDCGSQWENDLQT